MTIEELKKKNDKALSLEGFKILAAKWLFQYSDVDLDRFTFEDWYNGKITNDNIIFIAILRKIKSQKGKRELQGYLNNLQKVLFLCA